MFIIYFASNICKIAKLRENDSYKFSVPRIKIEIRIKNSILVYLRLASALLLLQFWS